MRSAVFFLLLLNHIQCRSGHRAKQQASPAPTARRSRTRNLPRWSGIAKYSSTTSSFRYSARPTNATIASPGTGTTPISRWNFITVSGGRVTGLNISGRYYQGVIPTTLGNLTKLQTLTLGSNQLTGRFPQELASLTNLESLTLQRPCAVLWRPPSRREQPPCRPACWTWRSPPCGARTRGANHGGRT